MNTPEHLKEIVKEKYSAIAAGVDSSCCGTAADTMMMAEPYTGLEGYVADADLGLGCGLPTAFANIRAGDMVVDLGSGAGNDLFVARRHAGPTGTLLGIDFTEKMVARARENAQKLGFDNVEFRVGDIEQMPIGDHVADVVVSNCVLNLVPDKQKAFAEIFRILKPGGHFSVSDIVLLGELPPAVLADAGMYACCVSGAQQWHDYLRIISASGFRGIKIQKERKISIPDNILSVNLSHEEREKYSAGEAGVYSITVYAEKPAEKSQEPCCQPDCCH